VFAGHTQDFSCILTDSTHTVVEAWALQKQESCYKSGYGAYNFHVIPLGW
jgi:hypothetical protein